MGESASLAKKEKKEKRKRKTDDGEREERRGRELSTMILRKDLGWREGEVASNRQVGGRARRENRIRRIVGRAGELGWTREDT